MKKTIILLLTLLCSGIASAQDALPNQRLQTMVDRLTRFGQNIPQEKVYLHMDNTCYFLGDTIWFAAYTRTTHNDRPSRLSGTLYVELYNQDGYLVERQLIEMLNGRGHGNFELKDDYYGGFYELRAYTRWQLNWGAFQHKNAGVSKEWFLSDALHDNYYRDYDKLYSRVFPVYDKPKKEGEFIEEMTMRPMRRYYKKDPDKRRLELNLYPEGGNVVAGLPCRVAYEVAWDDGQQAELQGGKPSRGIFEYTPQKGKTHKVEFTDKKGKKVSASLPQPEEQGVALRVEQDAEKWLFNLQLSEGLNRDSLGVTIMHEGVVQRAFAVSQSPIQVAKSELKEGVNQVTVFDVQGRILADRLFFNTVPDAPRQGQVSVQLANQQSVPVQDAMFAAYAPIQLQVKSEPKAMLSMAVRDAAHTDQLNDNATLRTEMLLASEIKGFVANPQQYFEKDDSEHRQALDLLMMIQGWRRFNWREMAIPGAFELTQQVERSPIIRGHVYKNPEMHPDLYTDKEFIAIASTAGMYFTNPEEGASILSEAERFMYGDIDSQSKGSNVKDLSSTSDSSSQTDMSESSTQTVTNESNLKSSSEREAFRLEMDHIKARTNDEEHERYNWNGKENSKEYLVHLELVSLDGKDSRIQEQMTKNGDFSFQLPGYYGNAVLFISAADTSKWSKSEKAHPEKHVWVQTLNLEEDLPDGHKRRFRVDPAPYAARIFTPYPRFVNPYNFYQEQPLEMADSLQQAMMLQDGTTLMRSVRIGATHGGMKEHSDSIPTFMIDAYEAYNNALDAGMYSTFPEDIVRAYVGDYGQEFPYVSLDIPGSNKVINHSNIHVHFGYDQTRRSFSNITMAPDSVFMRQNLITFKPYDKYGLPTFNLAYSALREYYQMQRLDKYIFYSDFQPRLSGDDRYYGAMVPDTRIAVYPFADDSRRPVYRDRRYIHDGYAYADDFYHPSYQNRRLDEKPKDYRRTLYWNPELQLNAEGEATIQLYNNGKRGQINISAEGMTDEGLMLQY